MHMGVRRSAIGLHVSSSKMSRHLLADCHEETDPAIQWHDASVPYIAAHFATGLRGRLCGNQLKT